MMLPNYTFVNIGMDGSERNSYVIAAHTYMCRQTLIGLFKYPWHMDVLPNCDAKQKTYFTRLEGK